MEWHIAAKAEWQIILADLVVLRHIGIEIIFAIKFADRPDLTAQHEPSERGEFQGFFIHDRQGARHPKTHRAYVGVGLRAVFDRARAEHLTAGLELNVNLEADGGDIVSHGLDFLMVGF